MNENRRLKLLPATCLLLMTAVSCPAVYAQKGALPDAPSAQQQQQTPMQQQGAAQQSVSQDALPAPAGPKLMLADAERMALQHNPNISVARLMQLAQAQVTREVHSGELPTAMVDLTAVGAHENSRLTAGALNNPIVYDRAAGGLTVHQLITDFGRTHNLVRSAQSNAKAELDTERATAEDVTLAVDQAFYQALTAQSVLKVAEQTVSTRQATGDQIGALTASKLRSTLDLSLANVQVSQAKLLVIDARSAEATAIANLNAILGSENDDEYDLVDETPANPQSAPTDAENLVQVALRARPDLVALQDRFVAAKQYSTAEHDLKWPTISALAAGGGTPVRADQIGSSWYGAAGANVSIPVFTGVEYSARAKEADLRAQAAQERVRNLREGIARDVRTAVLNAQMAFQRIGVTRELLAQADTALQLAQSRYQVGLSGIAELSQAQLAQTEAQIGYANARYVYQTALAVVKYQAGQ